MTKQIPLTQGQIAIVCDCHAHLITPHKWFAHRDSTTNSYYAVRMSKWVDGPQHPIPMHAVVNATPKGMLTDHINRDTLDNRCCNLRSADKFQSNHNQRISRLNTSGFKGVNWSKLHNKWRARIKFKGKEISLGLFVSPLDAAKAYDRAAIELRGEFAYLNFPQTPRP